MAGMEGTISDSDQQSRKSIESSAEAIYSPLDLDKREIRILHLKPSRNPEAVPDGILETVSLFSEPKPEYESVSYCWREVPGVSQIRLNGTIVNVPASSVKLLRRLRLEDKPRSLWIDAVCINQADLDERAAQVQLMAPVYQNAAQCLIWLGERTPKTDMVMDCIRYISKTLYKELSQATDGFSKFRTPPPSSFKYKATHPFRDNDLDPQDLVQFYKQAWFTRVWVLQEAVLPPYAVCYNGSSYVAWRDVRRVGSWLMEELVRDYDSFTGCDLSVRTAGALMFARAAAIFATQLKQWYTPILNLNAYLGATDHRDRFYGTLGLVFSKHEQPCELDRLHVDYTKPIHEVYRAATRTAIIVENSLYVLRALELLGPLDRTLEDPKSCSWARPLDARMTDVPQPSIRRELYSQITVQIGP